MYCPSCGYEASVELRYCSRCGANLSQIAPQAPTMIAAPTKLTGPTIAIGLTTVVGLGIIFGAASDLVRSGLHPAALTWMVLFSLATLFGCVSLLVRFLFRLISLQSGSAPQLKQPRKAELPPQVQQLPPRFEPVSSVTDHTTRTFPPAYREPSERK